MEKELKRQNDVFYERKGMKMKRGVIIVLAVLFLAQFAVAADFEIFNKSDGTDAYFTVNGTTGYTGLGVRDPSTILQILNGGWISALNNAGDSSVNLFRVNSNDEIEVGGTLNVGSFEFAEDSGLVTFADMPVSSTPASGTAEGYVFKLDGDNIMSIYSEADNAGGIQNIGVGINTTYPTHALNVVGTINATEVCLEDGTTCLSTAGSGSSSWVYGSDSAYNDTSGFKLGIGVSPTTALDIGGTGSTDGMIYFTGTAGGGGEGISYKDSGGGQRYALNFPGSDIVTLSNRASNGVVQVRANTATAGSGGEVTVAQFEDDEINLLTSGGSVGIGTSAPTNTFNVEGTSNLSGSTLIEGETIINYSTPVLKLADSSSGLLRLVSSSEINYIQSGLTTTGGSTAPLLFTDINADNTWMTIQTDGDVGIGTTAPVGKLDVYYPSTTSSANLIGINSTVSTSSATGVTYKGVYGEAIPYIVGMGYGVYGVSSGTSPTSNHGVYGVANGASATNNFGVYGVATGGSNAYGVYGIATSGLSNNYAGYFEGNVKTTGDLDVAGGDITTGTIRFGTGSTSGKFEFEDGSVCIGNGGCTASDTDGRLVVAGSIVAGSSSEFAYNSFGSTSPDLDGPDSGQITDTNDVFIYDDLEVDGTFYLTGGYTQIQNADIAELLITKSGRDNILCEQDPSCVVETYEKELDYGDVVCIDTRYGQVIKRCNEANSRLVAGVVSNTSKINMGNNEKYGYPIAVAGIVFTKVNTENGPISPGDLLVSANKPGYAMRNDDPRIATVLGKAYDFCDKDECIIPMFVALN